MKRRASSWIATLAVAGVALMAGAAERPVAMDFSSAGYAGGGVALPAVTAKFALVPSGQDDTRAIQAALEAAGKLPLDAQGFRGAVVLRGGTFWIEGQLRIEASGVVLRGEGATLLAAGESRRTLIEIRGSAANRVVGAGVRVADETVAAGAATLTLTTVEGFVPGARVLVRRPSTREWIAAVGANNFPGPGQYKDQRLDWVPGSRDIEWERTITAVDAAAKTVTLDAAITTALEAKFGGATLHPLRWPDRLRNVGVENLTCVSEVSAANPRDEEHAWMCVSIDRAEDAWVRHVTARRFVSSCVWIASGARAVTVEDCASREPVSEIGGWRRVSFYVGGQQVLVQRCTAEDGGRDFAAGHCAAGPIVFLDCAAVRANADSGPFESWASGVLYDRVSIAGAALALANLGAKTQGAAWTAANCVLWNCASAGRLTVDDPPGAPNRVVVDEATPSLYRAQLGGRRGEKALNAIAATPLARDAAGGPDRTGSAFAAGVRPFNRRREPEERSEQTLAQINGHFAIGGRAVFGGAMNSALWKGQLIPGRAREMGTSPTRWAPGRVGPGLTEDLDALTDEMAAQHTPFYYAFPGLWYDRRRDEHSIARREDGEVWGPFFESPWARSGQGQAWDGLSKYDLTKFNPWYFARLRELADLCTAKGLVLVYQAYDNHNVEEAAAHWAEFAWRPANAIQDTGFPEPPQWEGAAQNRHHIADQFYDVTNPGRRSLHERYIRHVLDVLGDSPNFMLTLGYQFAGPLAFQQFFIDTVVAWEKSQGRFVPLQLQTSKAVTDAILADPARAAAVAVIDLRYWQYLADGTLFAPDGQGKLAFRELRTEKFGRDAVMPSTAEFVYRQVREYRDRFPDKAIVAGHAGFGPMPVLMAGGAAAVLAESTPPQAGEPHDDAALLRFVAERVAGVLPRMRPVDGWAGDAWCLADKDRAAVLIYSASGGAIVLSPALTVGGAEGIWFNPRDGKTQPAELGDGGTIVKPTNDAWLLFVHRTG